MEDRHQEVARQAMRHGRLKAELVEQYLHENDLLSQTSQGSAYLSFSRLLLRTVTASGPSTGGAGFDPVHEPLKLRVLFGQHQDAWGRVLAGVTARGVTKVRIERTDGSSPDLRLGAPTIPDDFRWFSADEKEGADATVVAYGATGNVVQRWRLD